MPRDVGVVIVTYNSESVVGLLLDSLPQALGGATAQVVVVDNGSSDGTVALCRARGDCDVVEGENVGYAAGINNGAAHLGDVDAILVLNPDVVMAPGSIRAMQAALALPHTGIVVPRIVEPDGTLSHSLRRTPTLWTASGLGLFRIPRMNEYVRDAEAYEQPGIVDWAMGAVMLISSDCFRRLGGWDASYFLYSEETDFCLRASDIGYHTRYEPSATATHIGGASGRSGWTESLQAVNQVRLYRRRHGRIASTAYLLLSATRSLTWWARGHRESRDAFFALLVPRRRPPQLHASDRFLPS